MGWESVLGAVAGPIIGGLFGSDSASNQADATAQAGADTAAAAKYATDQQYKMFLQQQAGQENKYNQLGSDINSLFGSNGPTSASYNPQLASLLQGLRGTASNQLGLFNQFNPQSMAQNIYDKLSALGKPGQDQARANLESRLVNQGLLTSSPGYSQINSFDQAAGQSDLARQIQAMMTAQAQQQQYLGNANTLAGTASNIENQAYGPRLQALGIKAGVPVNSSQPIPSGALNVEGVMAQGQANVNAANITNSFWSSLANNQTLQSGIGSLFSNLGNGGLGYSGGVPINTTPTNYNGAEGLFAQLNGYGGGV